MNSFDEVLSFLQEPLGTFPDRSARWLLSNPDNLHGLLEIIGNDLVGSLDFRRVRRVNTTFIADNQIILPVGSPPGIWGIAEIGIRDRAGNLNTYDFTENVRFEVDENIAAAPTIARNALLPNFPNPFNPETWIPYQLANASEVSISIYAIDGQLVRRLNLGYQQAGVYHARGSAAYYDGKNDIGEAVVSGVYFYTLSVKGFSATRKMLILK
ncbi:MAG: T9SS type A sorting domain-containing protein [Candidatus Poribacteria bacterium]|nr:T9SS type A sorting domain-containing protein [Candidatus Poribacteria bacterium]